MESALTCDKQSWPAVAASLRGRGFSTFTGELFERDPAYLVQAREKFIASCRDLPADFYSRSAGRNRRYGRFLLNPADRSLELIAPVWDRERCQHVTPYMQEGCFNPEHPGEKRVFAALTDAQASNPFLHSLIMRCFETLPWSYPGDVVVGVHAVEFVVDFGQSITSTPGNVHCDGEPFTFGILIERDGVIGGENTIATVDAAGMHPDALASGQIKSRLTLEQPLDGWVVDDAKVAHSVSPVTGANHKGLGRRAMLLIDFTPADQFGTIQADRANAVSFSQQQKDFRMSVSRLADNKFLLSIDGGEGQGTVEEVELSLDELVRMFTRVVKTQGHPQAMHDYLLGCT